MMKKRELRTTGRIDKKGQFIVYMPELQDFFNQWKGQKMFITFEIAPTEKSELLKAYYYKYIVPTFKSAIWQTGDRKTEEQTEEFLRKLSPIMYIESININTGKYSYDLRSINDLSNAELIEHIETLKQIGAEEYGIYVHDPNTYIS